MQEDILSGVLIDEAWLTLEQLAAACRVEPAWLLAHAEEGLLPQAERLSETWRFSDKTVLRAQRMYRVEHDFDAIPELAALVADMQEEMDAMRTQLYLLRKP